MVITIEIENFAVMKILVDQGSSVDIFYCKTFKKLQIPKSKIQHYEDQIVGFLGERVDTRGYINLYTKFKEGRMDSRTINIHYLLVDANTSYNMLGRPKDMIVSTPHLAMKFPSPSGDVTIKHMDQKTVRECYATNLKVELVSQGREVERPVEHVRKRSPAHVHMVALANLDPRTNEIRVEHGEEANVILLKDQ